MKPALVRASAEWMECRLGKLTQKLEKLSRLKVRNKVTEAQEEMIKEEIEEIKATLDYQQTADLSFPAYQDWIYQPRKTDACEPAYSPFCEE
jgi:hypothetical protein